MENEKIEQLADFLGIEAEEIEVSDTWYSTFLTPDGTYSVMTQDEAYEKIATDLEENIGANGLSGFDKEMQQNIIQNHMNEKIFDRCLTENTISIAVDFLKEPSRDYASRLVEECIIQGYISEDKLTENKDFNGSTDELAEIYTEGRMLEIEHKYGSYAEAFQKIAGETALNEWINNNNSLVDVDSLAQALIDTNDYGSYLASYDGKTNETPDYNFFVFKQSNEDERTQRFLNKLKSEELEY